MLLVYRSLYVLGLSEIMASTSRDMVLTFVNSLVPTVRKALCDPLPEVRQAAAKTFDSLHSTVGSRALDDILPALLNQLVSFQEYFEECKYQLRRFSRMTMTRTLWNAPWTD